MQRVALSWLVFELTGSALFVALSYSLPQVSFALLGPFVGALADRVNRKYLLISAVSMMVIGMVGLSLLVYTTSEAIWPVISIAMALGVAMSTYFLCVQVLVLDVVEREDAMNGLSLWWVGMRAVSAIGAVISGVVIDRTGTWPAFMAAAVLFGLAILAISLMRHRPKPRVVRPLAVLPEIKAGFNHIFQARELAVLLLVVLVVEAFAWGTPSLLAIFASDRVFDVGATGLGVLSAAFSLGGMFGAAILANFGDFRQKGVGLFFVALIASIFLVGFSQAPWFPLATVLLAGLGAALAAFDTLNTVLIQGNVADEMRGRALGALQIPVGIAPAGPLLMGFLAGFLGVQAAVSLGAAVVFVVALGVWLIVPKVRRLE
jgi:MFS family permease